jgi:hypothetical protein
MQPTSICLMVPLLWNSDAQGYSLYSCGAITQKQEPYQQRVKPYMFLRLKKRPLLVRTVVRMKYEAL